MNSRFFSLLLLTMLITTVSVNVSARHNFILPSNSRQNIEMDTWCSDNVEFTETCFIALSEGVLERLQQLTLRLENIKEELSLILDAMSWGFAGYFEITHYCLCIRCTGIWSAQHPSRVGTGFIQKTASGTIPKAGRTIAVDTSIIPFGTEVLIDGYIFIAEDTGRAIVGNIVDILVDCHYYALQRGRLRNVRVYTRQERNL